MELSIYSDHDVNIFEMSEEEWEPVRVPRTPVRPPHGASRKDRDGIERYAALEFPRESVAWLLGSRFASGGLEANPYAPGRGNRIRIGLLPPRGL